MRKAVLFLLLLGVLAVAVAQVSHSGATTPPTVSVQAAHTVHAPAGHHLIRLSQLDPAQYASPQEYATWAYSTCSTGALVEVFNFYGRHYRIHDVLVVQAALGEITPAQGLLEESGIARTAGQFGFTTSWGYRLSLDQIIQAANAGTPVIVGWPPSRYPHGHLIVVTGGNGSMVSLADSSRYDRHTLTRAQFLTWWAGFSAVVTPAKGGQA